MYMHWRRSALNSAGALQDWGGEFRGIYTLFYTIKFRGEPKSGGARAPAAPPSSAPMHMLFSSMLAANLIQLTGAFCHNL